MYQVLGNPKWEKYQNDGWRPSATCKAASKIPGLNEAVPGAKRPWIGTNQ
jgi:hypothetical protein